MDIPKKTNTDLIHSGAKATLSLIPIIGGTAAEIFNALISSPFEKRVNEWMELVSESLKEIEKKQNGIVQSLPQNEEFISLLITASTNAYKTHLKEKHEQLKTGLLNSITSKLSFDIKEVYLNLVNELTLEHIELLKYIKDNADIIKSINEYQKLYDTIYNKRNTKLEITEFRFLLKVIESKGLVYISDDMRDIQNEVYEGTYLATSDGEELELPFIKITDFGSNFLSFILESNLK